MAIGTRIMQYNVAQLLKEPIGSSRSYQLDEVLGGVERLADHLSGAVRLLKTHHGVLVEGRLEVDARLTCGRCLGEFPLNLNLGFEEEFFPTVDADTGSRLPLPDGLEIVASEGVLIDEAHTLDLSEVVRQNIITNWPMKPLCRTECGGLCPECGANLNVRECQCRQPSRDLRWRDLSGWLRQGQN
jgi:uncharacterized protein